MSALRARRTSAHLANTSKLPSVTATELKNNLGEVLSRKDFQGIAVTRHKRPEFVVLPAEVYESMMQQVEVPLASLNAEFDDLVARMNTPKARKANAALFAATPAELGDAAANASGRRG
jgi:prevent-host-death family protein